MHFEEVGNTVYIANKSYALSRLLPSRSPEAKVLIWKKKAQYDFIGNMTSTSWIKSLNWKFEKHCKSINIYFSPSELTYTYF